METNITTHSTYNSCEAIRDVLNGLNGKFLIGCITGYVTVVSLTLILSGCDIKSNNFSMSIPSIFN